MLVQFFLPVPLAVSSALKRMCSPEDKTMTPLKWKLRLAFGHIELLGSLDQHTMKGVWVLTKVIDSIIRENS